MMKTKNDWIAISAAMAIGYFGHIIMSADAVIFPAFFGALMLLCLVTRIARPS
jgi:hypothetical protein